MKSRIEFVLALVMVCLLAPALDAQETSRVIPFNNVATSLPAETAQNVTVQLWDAAIGGELLFSEPHSVNVEANQRISFILGTQTEGGLDPALFPSGSSRHVDVVLGAGADGVTVLPDGRIALMATAFALSPGPEGPPGSRGEQGPQGPQGPPGAVSSVTAGDSSIRIGGSSSAVTVAVNDNGITNAHVANGALNPAKIAGTAATLGPNAFVGNQSITGNLSASGSVTAGATVTANTLAANTASIAGTGLNVLASGRVGIGTVTPSERLEVTGNIKATGAITEDARRVLTKHSLNTTEVTVSGPTTTERTLQSATLAGGVLGTNGGVEIIAAGTALVPPGQSVGVASWFGSEPIASCYMNNGGSPFPYLFGWNFRVLVFNDGATNVQIIAREAHQSVEGTVAPCGGPHSSRVVRATVDAAAPVVIRTGIVPQSGTWTVTSEILLLKALL